MSSVKDLLSSPGFKYSSLNLLVLGFAFIRCLRIWHNSGDLITIAQMGVYTMFFGYFCFVFVGSRLPWWSVIVAAVILYILIMAILLMTVNGYSAVLIPIGLVGFPILFSVAAFLSLAATKIQIDPAIHQKILFAVAVLFLAPTLVRGASVLIGSARAGWFQYFLSSPVSGTKILVDSFGRVSGEDINNLVREFSRDLPSEAETNAAENWSAGTLIRNASSEGTFGDLSRKALGMAVEKRPEQIVPALIKKIEEDKVESAPAWLFAALANSSADDLRARKLILERLEHRMKINGDSTETDYEETSLCRYFHGAQQELDTLGSKLVEILGISNVIHPTIFEAAAILNHKGTNLLLGRWAAKKEAYVLGDQTMLNFNAFYRVAKDSPELQKGLYQALAETKVEHVDTKAWYLFMMNHEFELRPAEYNWLKKYLKGEAGGSASDIHWFKSSIQNSTNPRDRGLLE